MCALKLKGCRHIVRRTVHTGSPNRHPNAYLEFRYCKLHVGHISMKKKYFKSPFVNAILQVLTPVCSASDPPHTLSTPSYRSYWHSGSLRTMEGCGGWGIQPKPWQCSTLCLGSLPDLFFSTTLAKSRQKPQCRGGQD